MQHSGLARDSGAEGASGHSASLPRNPHFDDNLVVWDDAYSGHYQPVAYSEQFDGQWKLFLDGEIGFKQHTGVETSDEYIDDRILELTGVPNYLLRKKWGPLAKWVAKVSRVEERRERRGVGGRLWLEPKFPINYFRGKRCIDLGCGAGRWTRTLVSLGANVTATDVSPHGLKSTGRFTTSLERLDLFDVIPKRPDLHNQFDFALSWGVVMCTHDPRLAFANVARTVKPGGAVYMMVYAPTYHAGEFVTKSRSHYHRNLHTNQERLAYAYEISGDQPENAINQLDMLNTFYNWVITKETIDNWCREEGFETPTYLNAAEPSACGHHVLAVKRA